MRIVRTKQCRLSYGGLFVKQRYLEARRDGALGLELGWVPGHGGDVWWVHHGLDDNGDDIIAAYLITEYEEVCESAVKAISDPDFGKTEEERKLLQTIVELEKRRSNEDSNS